ncbi:hypothetical protein [Streptococcus marmotae]|uniref:hypothetical protein n=1 Tax=Streptococcus marmotae TaxID=1825069 RepID=UPI000836AFDB|nr:hypothetical protein [Streptococcus marmotae]
MKKIFKRIKKYIILFLGSVAVLGGLMYFSEKTEADTYSPWVPYSYGPIQYDNFTYNGFKPMKRKFRWVKYVRTYTDNNGRSRYLYKDEIENLGIMPR